MLKSRQNEILEYLKIKKRVSVVNLAKKFFVSEMTIRRDLKELEMGGYIKRYNGGAIYDEKETVLPFEARKLLHAKEKKAIAEKVRGYLKDGVTVFIDSSSTCMYIIPLLCEYADIKLITNSLHCAVIAAKHHISCTVSGGNLYERDMCNVGGFTQEFLSRINVDIAFFSSQGITDDGVITDSDEQQTLVRKTVMKNSLKNIFIFDSTKQNKKFLYTLCTKDETDAIIII